MRHRVNGRRLGRSTSHRQAMGRNLMSALILHGRITTTEPKAKEYRPRVERLITLGRSKSVHRMRQAFAALRDKAAVQRLFEEVGPSFADRPGGYTRIVRLPRARLGDKGRLVHLELVNHVPKRAEAAAASGGDAEAGEE